MRVAGVGSPCCKSAVTLVGSASMPPCWLAMVSWLGHATTYIPFQAEQQLLGKLWDMVAAGCAAQFSSQCFARAHAASNCSLVEGRYAQALQHSKVEIGSNRYMQVCAKHTEGMRALLHSSRVPANCQFTCNLGPPCAGNTGVLGDNAAQLC
jgi:hypothetical protein